MDLERLRQRLSQRTSNDNQSELAKRIGVSQSLISKFINGKLRTLSRRTANTIASFLEMPVEGPRKPTLAYCGASHCPSIHVAVLEGFLYASPRFRPITPTSRKDCPYCKAVLFRECPHCGETINKAALYCPECAEPYVEAPDELEGVPDKDVVRTCYLRNRVNEQLCRNLGIDL
jgi:transcriptional regulator with XRE-family HTH domain